MMDFNSGIEYRVPKQLLIDNNNNNMIKKEEFYKKLIITIDDDTSLPLKQYDSLTHYNIFECTRLKSKGEVLLK